MARKLTLEERAKAKLGYFWDILPEEAREKARREVKAEDERRGEATEARRCGGLDFSL